MHEPTHPIRSSGIPAAFAQREYGDGLGGQAQARADVVVDERDDMQVGKGGDPGELVIIAGHDEPLDPLLRQFPCLTSLDRQGGDGASRVNSAHRVRALHDAITVGPDLTRMLGNLGGAPVLLVDDYADTGWTVALASRALRRAGSGRILPFVLAVAGAR